MSESLRITLGGNATVLIEGGGARIVTDPWLSERIGPWRRWRPAGLQTSDLAEIDAVLISHAHLDHLDLATLADVPAGTVVLTPGGAPALKLARATQLRPFLLAEWEEWREGEARVVAVPSVHTRGCLGYVVELGGRRSYFAGDSGPRTPFAEIGRRCGPLDVALLPVGGSTLAVGPLQRHLTPELAARAAAALGAPVVIPMHWGHVPCIPRAIDGFRGTPERFVRAMERLAPGVRVVVPEDGAPVTL